ncbi:hypothetical protein ALP29_00225 [Pseudomonas syringae pv. avii]|uniref:DUF2190 domain-containing protein n=1 Tax=Pseudomonas syringae pv. avii TaxID=663959 RepID=A0A3M5VJA8_PSESX|nr:capsid cement protein [Pseudomonas azotoformans]RMT61657.1 hypothetical protein ALP43_03216 [Pseudomonas azotoformans]RMU57765.1 hypothetical protein ALP29_00225 [Pseudomonas syringae pv. avii]
MKTQQPVLTTSVVAVTDLPRYRLAGFDGGLCAAGLKALGTVEADTQADNVAPINVLGICLVISGGAVAAGDQVESDAEGRAVLLAAGESNGFAMDVATAAGDVIRIVRGI